MIFTFTGKLNGIDNFNRIKIIADDPTIIMNNINDIKNPYINTEYGLECYIIINKYKEYYTSLVEINKYKNVTVMVSTKRYCFDGKKGTSLILKQLDINDI